MIYYRPAIKTHKKRGKLNGQNKTTQEKWLWNLNWEKR
jgi:hypothetical protein